VVLLSYFFAVFGVIRDRTRTELGKIRESEEEEEAELFVSAKTSSLLQPTQSSKATYLVLDWNDAKLYLCLSFLCFVFAHLAIVSSK